MLKNDIIYIRFIILLKYGDYSQKLLLIRRLSMKRKEIFEYLINYIEGRIPNNVFVEFYIKSKKSKENGM